MNTPTYPTKISNSNASDYTDYELYWELPPINLPNKQWPQEQSIRARFSYDHGESKAYGILMHEIEGNDSLLAEFALTGEDFHQITGHPIAPQDKLAKLREINGSVTIQNGIATFEDGTTLTL
jgi:hypothetical protein